MLAYSFLFKSIPFCSFIILLTLILYHGEYAGLVYSFLFYFIHLHSVMFFLSTLFWFYSALHYVLNDSFLFYPVDSVLTVVYWPLHFCSLLFSYIILSFLRFHVQLCCSILFMHYSSIMFVKSILFILILLCSGVLFYTLHWSDLYYLFLLALLLNHIC